MPRLISITQIETCLIKPLRTLTILTQTTLKYRKLLKVVKTLFQALLLTLEYYINLHTLPIYREGIQNPPLEIRTTVGPMHALEGRR